MGYMFRLLSSHLQALEEYRSNQQLLIGSVFFEGLKMTR